ncbi:hypothetical protein EB796_004147 [Bugula neritina]|uniref:G-protein coupled receptors family 1 profile domain-containing protein n=1 Tax=Bugula neritina TaxID=10212 RepID=A0A7J7KHZ4_BUGNE|nr:hypothetical protein EB796_004147 [Bugula neritina]
MMSTGNTPAGSELLFRLNSTELQTNTMDDEFAAILNDTTFSVPAVATVIVSSIGQLVTCGFLLLLFLLKKQIAKHASLVMISILTNICLVAICDLGLRAPLMVMKEDRMGITHPVLCMIMTLTPDYFMIAILLSLPMLSVERLIRLESKEYLSTRQTKHLLACLLVIAYSMALVVSILPTTNLFSADVNTRCNRNLLYGYAFAYVYTALTIFSVVLTSVFSIAVVFRLKLRLSHLHTSMRRKIVMKQGTVSAVVITGLLFLALVPFAASLQLVLMCGSNELTGDHFCNEILPDVIFRACIILHKLCLIALPVVFLVLNPALRRKIWATLRRPKQMEQVVTISSNSVTASKESVCDRLHNSDDSDSDGDFITITEDLTFGRSGDIKGEVKRTRSGSVRDRHSVFDAVDVMSVISEKSELSRTYSGLSGITSDERSTY